MAFTKPNVNNIWANTGSVIEPAVAKVAQGWVAEIPDFEFENWIQQRQDQFNAHVNQYGIPVWDSVTEYIANKSYVQDSNGVVYRALTTNTNKNPTVSPSDWQVAFNSFGVSYTKAESDSRFARVTNNLSDLTNIGTARSNLSVYSKVESDGRYLLESNNLSDLDSVATARANLGVYSTADVYSKTESDDRYLLETNNLSDLTNIGTARNNLSVYSKVETDSFFLSKANNLADLPNDTVARNNLGVYSKTESDARYLNEASNLADVPDKAAARANLGVPSELDFNTNDLIGDDGYQEFPGGLVFMWGRVAVGTDGEVTVTLPRSISFLIQVQATLTRNSAANLGVSTYSYTTTTFKIRNSDAAQDVVWFAIARK